MTGAVTAGTVVVGAALLVCLYVGYRRDNGAAVVNTVAAIGAMLVPVGIEQFVAGVETLSPYLTFWVAVAGFLHVLGMLGLYESTWWWDHLTHTLSAALVAALLYAWFLLTADGPFVGVATLAGTFALGVVWEGIELVAREVGNRYDIEPVLVHYGWRDTGFDLLFDVVGASLVVALDVRAFVTVVERLADLL